MTATATAKKAKANKIAAAEPTVHAPVVAPVGEDVLVPHSQLFISKHNTRKKRYAQSIPELAALIEHMGLLQRLLIIEEDGRYGVIGGGRRFTALALLIEQGKLPSDFPVECKLFRDVDSAKLSLAENSGREEMHGADQVEAFKTMIEQDGMTVAQVAAHFGVTANTVERHLKLARIAPRFVGMYRNNEVGKDVLMALALAEDHATQEAAWDSLQKHQRTASKLREILTEGEVKANSRLAQFVGLKAYEKAGGAVRSDLFAEGKDGVYLQNPDLLHSLASAKLQKKADAIAEEGWSWVECSLDAHNSAFRNFGREQIGQRKTEGAEAEQHQKLLADFNAKDEALQALYDSDETGDDYDAKCRELSELTYVAETALEDFESSLAEWTPEQKARAGALVQLDWDGKIDITYGLIRPSEKKAVAQSMAEAGEEVPHGMARSIRPEFSERLMRDMSAHRTAALQAAMANNPKVALVALAHSLAMSVFGERYYRDGAIKITLSQTGERAISENAPGYIESQAGNVLEQAQQMWADQLPRESAAMFAWLLNQPQPVLLDLLAFCTARSLNAIHGRARDRDDSDFIAEALGVDMADWWTASPENYFSGVSRDKALEAVREATGYDATKEVTKMKKAEWQTFCTAKLHGTRWLPSPLRVKSVAVEAGAQPEPVESELSEDVEAA